MHARSTLALLRAIAPATAALLPAPLRDDGASPPLPALVDALEEAALRASRT
jgi:hypothetical protein